MDDGRRVSGESGRCSLVSEGGVALADERCDSPGGREV